MPRHAHILVAIVGPQANGVAIVGFFWDEEIYNKLVAAGIDKLLSRHVAYNFVRDPIVIFKARITPFLPTA